ncbi:MAG: glycerophosphoryl diester phosphodiesterase membrane domain-containing protein, partial [Actinomycetota bacterium]|nr:glycerophosphoryl diester phosphodiesterase membrane domain-containing protein [Actinomycetota bacterium]
MQAAELRPLSVGEKLDVAIKIYWRNALTLFRVVLIVVAPVQAITALILASATPEPETLLQPGFDPTQPGVDPTITASEVWAFVAGVILIVIVSFIASTLATAACFKAVSDAYLGGEPNWRSSLAFAGRRLHSVLWISILGGLLAFGLVVVAGALTAALGLIDEVALILGTLLIIAAMVVATWIWVGWVVAVPAFLTEGTKGRRALGRSFGLVKGRWWRTFGLYLLAYLLVVIVGSIIGRILTQLQFTDIGDSLALSLIVNAIGQTISAVITTPFIAAFIIVLYFDLRVRKEGFDLQLLAERIGLAPGSLGQLRPMTGYLPAARPGPGGSQPPFWPPPPGWQPGPPPPGVPPPAPPPHGPLWSGGAPAPPPGETQGVPPQRSTQPPFWPPPPGWEPPPD